MVGEVGKVLSLNMFAGLGVYYFTYYVHFFPHVISLLKKKKITKGLKNENYLVGQNLYFRALLQLQIMFMNLCSEALKTLQNLLSKYSSYRYRI